jgi:hypothetical protein
LMVPNQERSKSLMVLIRREEELDGSKSGEGQELNCSK